MRGVFEVIVSLNSHIKKIIKNFLIVLLLNTTEFVIRTFIKKREVIITQLRLQTICNVDKNYY